MVKWFVLTIIIEYLVFVIFFIWVSYVYIGNFEANDFARFKDKSFILSVSHRLTQIEPMMSCLLETIANEISKTLFEFYFEIPGKFLFIWIISTKCYNLK